MRRIYCNIKASGRIGIMEKIRAHLPAMSDFSLREKALLTICAVLLVAILIITCISINIRSNMQRDYANVRTQIGQSLYSDLYMLTQTFDMTSVPNADIKNAVLPQMKNYAKTKQPFHIFTDRPRSC